jgi:ubiquinone/menaquinone biosynthesis C-methylase UbiE
MEHQNLLASKAFSEKSGIKSFTDANHFDTHWEENYTPEIPEAKIHVAKTFLKPIQETFQESSERHEILDVGCGDGIHVYALQEMPANIGMHGIDISLAGLLAAQKRDTKNRWSFVHGDAGQLPYKNEVFDASFSFGVLAYTDNPERSFSEMVRVTKKGGIVGVWIYPKSTGVSGFLFNTVRAWCKLTGKLGTHLAANLITPFIGLLPTRSKLTLSNASWKQCKEVVMVNIAPKQLQFYTEKEVLQWFVSNNLEPIEDQKDYPITIWGRKQ